MLVINSDNVDPILLVAHHKVVKGGEVDRLVVAERKGGVEAAIPIVIGGVRYIRLQLPQDGRLVKGQLDNGFMMWLLQW